MSIFSDNKGFFQGGKSFGGRGLFGEGGVVSSLGEGISKRLMGKPCEGQPGVCPYTCKPLQTPVEKAEGVSAEAKQMLNQEGTNPNTGRPVVMPQGGKFDALNQAAMGESQGLNRSNIGQDALQNPAPLQGMDMISLKNKQKRWF